MLTKEFMDSEEIRHMSEYEKCVNGLKTVRECFADLSASCMRYFRNKSGDDVFDSQITEVCAAKK